jgi:hypothetical protein
VEPPQARFEKRDHRAAHLARFSRNPKKPRVPGDKRPGRSWYADPLRRTALAPANPWRKTYRGLRALMEVAGLRWKGQQEMIRTLFKEREGSNDPTPMDNMLRRADPRLQQ